MSAHPTLSIASVNMCKHNAATHTLLNSTNNTQLLLIQEPWYNMIGMARKDLAHQGVNTLGGVSSPAWEILYPNLSDNRRPKVMAYTCKHTPNNRSSPPFTAITHHDICSHPTVQVLNIILDKEK
jgi:hypothetical protein